MIEETLFFIVANGLIGGWLHVILRIRRHRAVKRDEELARSALDRIRALEVDLEAAIATVAELELSPTPSTNPSAGSALRLL